MPLSSLPALAHDLTALADRLRQSTVAVQVGSRTRRGPTPAGHGSGIVWQADGLIVTNAHVARADQALVTLPDERRATARVVARDPARDLALLQVEADGLTPATPADAAALTPGALVFAFGHPLGHTNALAAGVLHATGDARPPWARGPAGAGARPRVALVQADVRLLPGNSGSPLANASGHVLGVNAMVVNGLGVAIASSEVTDIVERHLGATAHTPKLGVALRPVRVRTPGTRDDHSALLLLEVSPNSAAARAGLLPGDVLLTTGGVTLATADDLGAALRRAAGAGTLRLELGRGGRRTTVSVPLDGAFTQQRAA